MHRAARSPLVHSRLWRACVAALALVVLVSGFVRAGTRYFYCPIMDATASEACCSADHADHRAGDAPDVRAADCCEARHLASLPTGASPRAPEALDAPAVALVTPMPTREALDRALAAVTRSLAPLDVPYDSRPPPSEARARLMVFLN